MIQQTNQTPTKQDNNEARSTVENPFLKSGRLLRSPQLLLTPKERDTPIIDLVTEEESDFLALGKELKTLVDLLEDGKRRTLHQPIRDAIMKANALYDRIDLQLKGEKSTGATLKDNSCQTSPLLKTTIDLKRKQPNKDATPTAKRSQTATKSSDLKENGDHQPSTSGGNKTEEDTGWSTVTNRRKKKNDKKSEKRRTGKKPRPDAIIIKATGTKTYADMIRKMQSDPNLVPLGNAVSKLRRTQKGELLIQLKSGENPTAEFKEGLGTALSGDAEVISLTTQRTIECKDIDEVTSVEDIVKAIKSQFDLDVSQQDVQLRKSYGETQVASIKTSETTAKKLLEKGKLKLGWSNCHLREKTTLTKCFRCLEFGHISRNCKSSIDRSKMCRKCGENGHIAKGCAKTPSCMFCIKDHPDNAKHVAGSNNCPVFRRALNKKR